MKTNQEILDFFGVEVGKKYKITNNGKWPKYYVGLTFVVKETISINKLYFEIDKYDFDIWKLNEFDYEEVKSAPLTDIERAYLGAVIKPFRDQIVYITKVALSFKEYIKICTKDNVDSDLPLFLKGKYYAGMEAEKEYTLEELGL